MTNFQAQKKRPNASWLNPERAVFVVPIFAGLVLAATLATVVITPQMVQLRERRSVVEIMEQKSEALPGLMQALVERRLEQAEMLAQQQRLLALIAGTGELDTFLAQLNDLAKDHQVVVTSTEPGLVERAPLPVDPNDPPAAGADEDVGVGDPLLMKGLEKRSARIVVEGAFVQVLGFLQSLESLEVFVVTEELSVVASPVSENQSNNVRLGLTLLAYGVVNPDVVDGSL